ncbi:hypothetical protein GOBAR_AA37626 [Gossypium barbadense]|uniref:Uncharacterized protein n=1 Tax=Gossypium barbadense TaxID=3634 RepID=A0A2P5VW94_GOSBA|nr:hypothetical protein GOBAR_AA37626 [Gossypium barbadense]
MWILQIENRSDNGELREKGKNIDLIGKKEEPIKYSYSISKMYPRRWSYMSTVGQGYLSCSSSSQSPRHYAINVEESMESVQVEEKVIVSRIQASKSGCKWSRVEERL